MYTFHPKMKIYSLILKVRCGLPAVDISLLMGKEQQENIRYLLPGEYIFEYSQIQTQEPLT